VGHPLLKIRKPTLRDVAAYPIITHDPAFSGRWKVIDASHLFEPSMTSISLRINAYLRNHTFDFIRMFAPHLTRDAVRAALQEAR